MTPEEAGTLCNDLDTALRGAELNLGSTASLIVAVIRHQAWQERRIRTGQIVRHRSFLELLTTPPLEGFGEDPRRVEALLRDDAEALRMFREATTASPGRPSAEKAKETNDNIISNGVTPKLGTSRAYLLDRLYRQTPGLYERVVAKELSARAAAIEAGFIHVKTPLEQLEHWWTKASAAERRRFRRLLEADT